MTDILTYETWDEQGANEKNKAYKDYFDVIKGAFREYGDGIVYACSFGAEGIVLLDLINKVREKAKVIFLDTGLHFPETYELIDKVKARYPSMQFDMVKPKMSLDVQAKWYGEELWKENSTLCCHMRKVVPLTEALSGATAWISGLRREQSPTRKHTEYLNKDDKFHMIKICPLIHWTWEDVMNYIKLNQLDYNPLHDQGYPSIGCATCTNRATGSDDQRSGRWAGQSKTECGLHLANNPVINEE